MLGSECNAKCGGGNALDTADVVDSVRNGNAHMSLGAKKDISGTEGGKFEPDEVIEFESHEAAYSFYQEYAKSMGFTTSIKNSRRSKKTKDFIDAKFACSRYGITPESDNSSNRRSTVKKTDCKASMHVKRKRDGRWHIREFIKEHNHELLPALACHFHIHRNVRSAEKNNMDILHAVSEGTSVEMSRQSGGIPETFQSNNEFDHQTDSARSIALDEGDARFMMDIFMQLQKENSYFFYSIELNREQRLKNIFWVDAKTRKDYISFSDAVFVDTTFVESSDKVPIALFLGVNHHFQPMLLGCALLADESKSTYVWLLKTWLIAIGGKAPNVIISNQDKELVSAIDLIFPCSRHCFPLWHIMEKIPANLGHVLRKHENFMNKFNKCIFRSLTDEDFDLRWWKMVTRFELHDNQWVHSLYVERKKWAPLYMRDAFLAGLSPHLRSDSPNSFFDKYIHKKMNVKEFMKQYVFIHQNWCEEESLADFNMLHRQPDLKSPSPWEKQMSTTYTHSIFRKFQVEVLGVLGCHPTKEREDGVNITFKVDDCEKGEHFFVMWNEETSEVSCSCLMFEYRGFLCRHSMIVLQIRGLSRIPSRYILNRWTKDAKLRQAEVEETDRTQSRVQRYNDLCKIAIALGEEGSSSEENYNIARRALVEALKNCVSVNNRTAVGSLSNPVRLHFNEEESMLLPDNKTNKKKKNTSKKRKKQQQEPEAVVLQTEDNLEPLETLSSQEITLNGYYGSQQNVHGLLNLMEPPQDGYYVNQQALPGMLNSIPPGHDTFYAAQHSLPALGHLDFRQATFPYAIQSDHSIRPPELHQTTRN